VASASTVATSPPRRQWAAAFIHLWCGDLQAVTDAALRAGALAEKHHFLTHAAAATALRGAVLVRQAAVPGRFHLLCALQFRLRNIKTGLTRPAPGRGALAEIFQEFTEGFDTGDLRRAAPLLHVGQGLVGSRKILEHRSV
jgi:hypothetical protein